MSQVRVRFAPSPTGLLHIGGARTALFNWLYARHTGGKLILRIEDTDAARNTQESLAVIFKGLSWVGIDWDEGPQADGSSIGDRGPYFQSQRREIYDRYVEKMLKEGKAYESDGAVKLKTSKAMVTVPDLICGNVQFDRTLEPDLVIQRKDGSHIFHLVNVVDDLEMGVTHVIRAEEHLANTPKHLALFEAIGAPPPHYAHVPIILNPSGSKMSKRDKGAAVGDYIEKGYWPAAVRNYLCLLGWSPRENREIFPMEEAIAKFDLPQVNRSPAHFDADKLFWMNGEYMRAISVEELEPLAQDILNKAGVLPADFDRAYFRAALAIVKEKIKLAAELPEWMDYFFKDDFAFDPASVQKVFTPLGLDNLRKLDAELGQVKPFDATTIEERFKALAAQTGQKAGAFIHPARLAASGKSVGPSLYHLLEVLGMDRVQRRMKRALEMHSG
jgi:nondiscriminating glutamyl-tRNA synthetase